MGVQNINPVGKEQRTEKGVEYKTTFEHTTYLKQEDLFVTLKEYGYKPDGKKIPSEYLSRVSSIRNNASIIAPLQKDISMRVQSSWAPFIPTSLLFELDPAVQLVTGAQKSLITKATSRRIWHGSSPITLSLEMHFEAVLDPVNEVLNPLKILGAMALPAENSSSSKGFLKNLPFLGPPGPSPFQLNIAGGGRNSYVDALNSLQKGDRIIVELGLFLTFYNVIIKEVSYTIPIKFDRNGHPISATVNVVFETYEMMTVESFNDSFNYTQTYEN